MITKKEFLIDVGLIAIFINIFIMLIAPTISESIYELLRSTSIALFGSGLILFDILQKMLGKDIFKNNTDITKLGTFFLVFWGVLSTIFTELPLEIVNFIYDWGLIISGIFLIVSVSLMDAVIKEG